jgi:hypothetical protein
VDWHAGRSLSEMSPSLGVDRKTLRKYVAPAADEDETVHLMAKLTCCVFKTLSREWLPSVRCRPKRILRTLWTPA